MERKLILFELNEVPFRVLERYCRDYPQSALSKLLCKSRQFDTKTDDNLVLDPWVSWPTLHRGVNDETHGILHLGQDISAADRKYPPIWQLLKRENLTVGVFGSLHSSNIPPDAKEYSFYIPDYFDATAFAQPPDLLPFQELNLQMTRASARNVNRSLPSGAMKVLLSMPRLGVKFSTIADMAWQLLNELGAKSLRIRRRSYQALIMGDLFIQQLERTKPRFATFYTNHVAAAMHRYWAATFPEDYDTGFDAEWIRKYSREITFALLKLDIIVGRVAGFIDRNPEYSLLVASSMGQAAIPAQKTYEFLTVTDLRRFMTQLGAPDGGWAARPAMVPCQSVVVRPEHREAVRGALSSMVIGGSNARFDKRPVAPFSYDEAQPGSFQFFVQFDSYSGPEFASIRGREIAFESLGLGRMQHEDGVNCTAQHVVSGSLFTYNASNLKPPSEQRSSISTSDVVPSILKYFGIAPPPYLQGTASIEFTE